MFSIIQAPNVILATPTKPATFFGPKLAKIIEEMKQTLIAQKDPEGVGLAANQVGLPYDIFLARFDENEKAIRSLLGQRSSNKNIANWPIRVFINPEIVDHSPKLQVAEGKKAQLEGCLSKPQYYGAVRRWQWVKISYQTLDPSTLQLQPSTETFTGFPAVVIQHEMDHLQGKIFIERILEQHGRLYKITGKDKKGKEIWEEVDLS